MPIQVDNTYRKFIEFKTKDYKIQKFLVINIPKEDAKDLSK